MYTTLRYGASLGDKSMENQATYAVRKYFVIRMKYVAKCSGPCFSWTLESLPFMVVFLVPQLSSCLQLQP